MLKVLRLQHFNLTDLHFSAVDSFKASFNFHAQDFNLDKSRTKCRLKKFCHLDLKCTTLHHLSLKKKLSIMHFASVRKKKVSTSFLFTQTLYLCPKHSQCNSLRRDAFEHPFEYYLYSNLQYCIWVLQIFYGQEEPVWKALLRLNSIDIDWIQHKAQESL